MPFVLDASGAVAWCFDDESDSESASILDQLQDEAAIAPAIWPLEVANALRNGERRGRLEPGDSLRFTELLGELLVEVEPLTLRRALNSVLFVAREYDLSAYDAAYLELAIREGCPLASLDRALRAAAERAGVALVG